MLNLNLQDTEAWEKSLRSVPLVHAWTDSKTKAAKFLCSLQATVSRTLMRYRPGDLPWIIQSPSLVVQLIWPDWASVGLLPGAVVQTQSSRAGRGPCGGTLAFPNGDDAHGNLNYWVSNRDCFAFLLVSFCYLDLKSEKHPTKKEWKNSPW